MGANASKYKKGDWVRFATEKPRYCARYVATPVEVVKRLNDYLVVVEYPVGGILQNVHVADIEPWQPKVGERVRYVASYGTQAAGKEAVVLKISDYGGIQVRLAHTGAVHTESPSSLEPITDTLPVAEQPAAPIHDITAATVDAINDEYGPVVREVPAVEAPKFKVGDRVQSLLTGSLLTITGVEQAPRSGKFVYIAKGENLARGRFIDEHLRRAPTTAIVALIKDGQPLPADRPAVHTSAEAADAEARRLAGIHKGQEFGVFTLGAVHREACVFEHEWQRLAAAGQRVAAIKALRSVAGLDLKPAKESVDYFISFAA